MDLPTHDELLARIDAFLLRHGMAESRFGRDATGEGDLVASIRKGRSPTLKLLQRIVDFMVDRDAAFELAEAEAIAALEREVEERKARLLDAAAEPHVAASSDDAPRASIRSAA